jgi:EcoEI R protein C-terminal
VPYAERVDRAVQRLRKAHKFTDPQAVWLGRIAKAMKHETVVDRPALDTGQFKAEGGFTRLNRVFDDKLESLLGELADEVWKDAGRPLPPFRSSSAMPSTQDILISPQRVTPKSPSLSKHLAVVASANLLYVEEFFLDVETPLLSV